MRLALNFYPPYFCTGIHVTHISGDFRYIKVKMPLRWYNKNLQGSHFGGNLAAMTDPFYMLMLIKILAKEYVVWDYSAEIEFVKPGRGVVYANFEIDQGRISEIIEKTKTGEKYFPVFHVSVVDENGDVVARIRKTLYVRRKSLKETVNQPSVA